VKGVLTRFSAVVIWKIRPEKNVIMNSIMKAVEMK
jgi:hypothetical protein